MTNWDDERRLLVVREESARTALLAALGGAPLSLARSQALSALALSNTKDMADAPADIRDQMVRMHESLRLLTGALSEVDFGIALTTLSERGGRVDAMPIPG